MDKDNIYRVSMLSLSWRSAEGDVHVNEKIPISTNGAWATVHTKDFLMLAVIQRVISSEVRVGDDVVGQIGTGILVLLGISHSDEEKDADYLADKVVHLRIFDDDDGKMNRSLVETGGEIMVVSQFTLLGNCRKGRRPSFVEAAPPERAENLYEYFVDQLRLKAVPVATGRFQARMAVSLVNDGPVTLILESK